MAGPLFLRLPRREMRKSTPARRCIFIRTKIIHPLPNPIMARLFTGVLPSGVSMTLRNLNGNDQAILTSQKKSEGNSSLFRMLAGCIVELGDKTNITENDVKRLLHNDRKDALVMLRQHSLKFDGTFDFVYDWPSDGKKQKQQYQVAFDTLHFERTPYRWVQQELDRIAALPAEDRPTLGEGYTAFPVLYASYGEMLAAHGKQRFVVPESGDEVEWTLKTGETEQKFSGMNKNDFTSTTLLQMYNPLIVLGDEGDNQNVRTTWNIGAADILDVEALRREIRSVEGFIDTMLAIRNQEDERVDRVDLTGVTSFFFPSSAL